MKDWATKLIQAINNTTISHLATGFSCGRRHDFGTFQDAFCECFGNQAYATEPASNGDIFSRVGDKISGWLTSGFLCFEFIFSGNKNHGRSATFLIKQLYPGGDKFDIQILSENCKNWKKKDSR